MGKNMVKHIVMWRLKPENQAENSSAIKQGLEALVGQIEGLIKMEVGVNINPKGWDLCLYSEYESEEALAYYQQHPLHKAVQAIVHAAMTERVVCDYLV